MGGNALKNTETECKSRDAYLAISGEVCGVLMRLFPGCHPAPTLAYANKETFGDADIVVKSEALPHDWQARLQEAFQPNEMVENGLVVSFDYKKLQIDLIRAPARTYDFACVYYAYNDLGNFMGRVARAMGFKYGHTGLWKVLRDTQGQPIENIEVSIGLPEVFSFMGYDYGRWQQGFDTLEDIFEYAVSSPYFHRKICQFDAMNHVARIRDKKRDSYNRYLKWLADKPELDKYPWADYDVDGMSEERQAERTHWQYLALRTFPAYAVRIEAALEKHIQKKKAKQLWNGDIVRDITGLSGKLLGVFMNRCREQHPDFDAWVVTQTPSQIAAFIRGIHTAV